MLSKNIVSLALVDTLSLAGRWKFCRPIVDSCAVRS